MGAPLFATMSLVLRCDSPCKLGCLPDVESVCIGYVSALVFLVAYYPVDGGMSMSFIDCGD